MSTLCLSKPISIRVKSPVRIYRVRKWGGGGLAPGAPPGGGLAGTGAEAKLGDDGVPTWLRKRFQAEVHRQYSDHLPVYCMLS